MRILVIDVGGNNVKIRQPEQHTVVKIPSGPALTAARMVKAVMRATAGWKYDAVSIGYPGPVANGRPAREPHNLGGGWTRYDYRAAFHKPVRLLNDAAMQALGSYHGGRMLYLGPRHRPRIGARDRWRRAAAGARSPSVSKRPHVRGLRRPARVRTIGEARLGPPRDPRRRGAATRPAGGVCGAGRRQREAARAAPPGVPRGHQRQRLHRRRPAVGGAACESTPRRRRASRAQQAGGLSAVRPAVTSEGRRVTNGVTNASGFLNRAPDRS